MARGRKGARATRRSPGEAPVTIKKYANRRLYNTATSSYVTLDDLCRMVREGTDFVVYDAKSGDDITRSVLTQIIVEEEGKGQNLLPVSFLRQLIALYGDSLQNLVPRYLEDSMRVFARNQEQMRAYMQQALDGFFPFTSLEQMSKRNVAMLEEAMKMFSPFRAREKPTAEAGAGAEQGKGQAHDALEELRDKIDVLERQLEELRRSTRR